jgi:hypothetical protein
VAGPMSSVRLWEWVVDEGGGHAPSNDGDGASRASCGVSGVRHSAMDALSL